MRWLLGALLATPAGAAPLVLLTPDGQPVAEGATLAAEGGVRFRVDAAPGYLYLVELSSSGTSVLEPRTGRVWVHRGGVGVVVPSEPSEALDIVRPSTFRGEASGEVTYVLLDAPSPRGVTGNGWIPSLDHLVAGPPFVQGPAAGPARELGRFRVVWAGDAPPRTDADPPAEATPSGPEDGDDAAPRGDPPPAPPADDPTDPMVGGEEEGNGAR